MTALEKIARAIAPISWARLGLADTLAHENRRKASMRHAEAAVQALYGAGFVVVTREFAERWALEESAPTLAKTLAALGE